MGQKSPIAIRLIGTEFLLAGVDKEIGCEILRITTNNEAGHGECLLFSDSAEAFKWLEDNISTIGINKFDLLEL